MKHNSHAPTGSVLEKSDDPAIRNALRLRLMRDHGSGQSVVLIEELGLCHGSVRVDLAVVTQDFLHGFEIKSAQDTLKRLPSQVEVYSGVLDMATLVVDEHHLESAVELVPPWWGVVVARQRSGGRSISLKSYRKPKKNPAIKPRWLVESLWRGEAMEILQARRLSKGLLTKPKHFLHDAVAANLTLDELRFEVRTRMRIRPTWTTQRSSIGEPPWLQKVPLQDGAEQIPLHLSSGG